MSPLEFSCLSILAVLVLLFAVWRGRRPRFSHRWRIQSAERALKKIRQIGVESGPAQQFSYLRKVDPFVFEELVMSGLQAAGYKVRRSTRYTGDGGIDGECWLGGKRYLVQIKRYSGHIHATDVAAFSELCEYQRIAGLFIHSGRTGPDARRQSLGQVEIVSGAALLSILGIAPTDSPLNCDRRKRLFGESR